MTMFVSAFPMCTVLALVNNYVQLRVDAWTLCQVVQVCTNNKCLLIFVYRRLFLFFVHVCYR